MNTRFKRSEEYSEQILFFHCPKCGLKTEYKKGSIIDLSHFSKQRRCYSCQPLDRGNANGSRKTIALYATGLTLGTILIVCMVYAHIRMGLPVFDTFFWEFILGTVLFGVILCWVLISLSRYFIALYMTLKEVVKPLHATQQTLAASKATYATALDEIENGNVDRGLWAKALADCDGNTDRAKAAYIRFRHQETHAEVPASSAGRRTGLAVSSLVCGILGGWASTLSIPAVICGHMALNKIKKESDAYGGKGMAIAGLALGYIGLLLAIILGTMKGLLRVQLEGMGYK